MTTDIRVITAREFVKATVQGTFDLNRSKAILEELASADPSPTGFDVMLDVREAPSYLSLADLSTLAIEFTRLQIGAGHKTAVLTSSDRYDNALFFAASARNLGGRVHALTLFEEAFDWLALPRS